MKKTLIILAALSLAAPLAAAQEQSNRDLLDALEQETIRSKKVRPESEFKKVRLDVLPELGYGTYFITSPDFQGKPWNSCEWYLHALRLSLRPVRALSLNVAVGISADRFETRSSVFFLDADKNVRVRPMTGAEAVDKKNNSSLNMGSVRLPLTLQVHAGDWILRAGAEALYSFSPRVSTDLYQGDVRTFTETKGARITPWSYDFLASVSWDGLGLYAKYQPASARRLPVPGPAFSTWAFGIFLSY